MKLFLIASAAMLVAGTALAQSTTGTGPAGNYPGNTGRVENGGASNNPTDSGSTVSTSNPSGTVGTASDTMAADTMTAKNGKWMMGDRKATKAEIADWKKAHPGMSTPQ